MKRLFNKLIIGGHDTRVVMLRQATETWLGRGFSNGAETEALHFVRKRARISALRFAVGDVDDAVKAVKQKNRGELRIVDGPRARVDAGLKQLDEMIDDDILDEAMARGRRKAVEENIVQTHGVEIAGDARIYPRCQFSFPIVSSFFRDCCFYFCEELLRETIAERGENIIFRRKIKIKRAFGDVCAESDLLDGGSRDAALEK